jgi:hypothetical protein
MNVDLPQALRQWIAMLVKDLVFFGVAVRASCHPRTSLVDLVPHLGREIIRISPLEQRLLERVTRTPGSSHDRPQPDRPLKEIGHVHRRGLEIEIVVRPIGGHRIRSY